MTKGVNKKSRRLKRSIRKTLGTLFLISALIVAAIPTENLQAEGENSPRANRVPVTTDSTQRIPQINDSTVIYTTKDRKYRFAYMSDGGTDKIAVLLGYSALTLENGLLEIPESVDAYAKFTETLGTDRGYVAVGKAGNFLYWKECTKTEWKQKIDPITQQPMVDNEGNPVMEEVEVEWRYNPCYADTYDTSWGSIAKEHPEQLYYDKNFQTNTTPKIDLTENDAVACTDLNYQIIQGATVAYIGNQWLKEKTGADGKPISGEWVLGGSVNANNKDKGIFANNGNIHTLVVKPSLMGIGDYAFYRCSYLDSITLGNGLNTIGNGAFSDCTNMTAISLDIGSNLNQIGDHAFYNCQSLGSFTLPIQVSLIGDSAFEGCTSLKSVDLCSAGNFNNLTTLGWDLFKNCEALESVTFPDKCTSPVYISTFEGCRSLKSISTRNNQITFPEEAGVYTYEQFKAMLEGPPVGGAFYFEGMENSALHQMCTDNYFAFSYIDYLGGVVTNLDRYEITVAETGGRATYEVNSSNRLISCRTEPGVKTVTIPARIGPHAINYIASNTFQDHCNITKVTIPVNILSIDNEAFRGCHNLADVIFDTANVTIGDNAFKTQEVRSHETNCPNGGQVGTDPDMSPAVKLKFTGPVSSTSGPFKYAMSENGKYNIESQQSSYITYYSGWPSNMEIQYNPDSKMSELVNFPSLSDLKNGVYNSQKYAYITPEHEQALRDAVNKYVGSGTVSGGDANRGDMTEYEWQIINAAMGIVIPEGVDSVKPGLFKMKDDADIGTLPENESKTVEAYSLKRIQNETDEAGNEKSTFAGCKNISSIKLLGGTETLDSYAFEGCDILSSVTLPPTVSQIGVRPFANCPAMSQVDFSGSPYFSCENSIIYELDDAGAKEKIVQCLEGRTNVMVTAAETAGVKEMYPEDI